jgi:hypothetical protein
MKILLGVGLALASSAGLAVFFQKRRPAGTRRFCVEKDGTSRCYEQVGEDRIRVESHGAVYHCSLRKWYCSCKGFKFKKYPHKICVHLRQANQIWNERVILNPPFQVFSTSEQPPFQLIGDHPTKSAVQGGLRKWFWSIKHDGIRVCTDPTGRILTRGGLRLKYLESQVAQELGAIHPDLIGLPLDCELCTAPITSHDRVMELLIHRSTPEISLRDYRVHVLDICWSLVDHPPVGLTGATFAERRAYLEHLFAGHVPQVMALNPIYPVPQGVPVESLLSHLTANGKLGSGTEGIVCRRGDSLYHTSRTGNDSFKLKFPSYSVPML